MVKLHTFIDAIYSNYRKLVLLLAIRLVEHRTKHRNEGTMKKWHAGDVVILPGEDRMRATVEVAEDSSGSVICVWFDKAEPQQPHRETFKAAELRFPDDDGE